MEDGSPVGGERNCIYFGYRTQPRRLTKWKCQLIQKSVCTREALKYFYRIAMHRAMRPSAPFVRFSEDDFFIQRKQRHDVDARGGDDVGRVRRKMVTDSSRT